MLYLQQSFFRVIFNKSPTPMMSHSYHFRFLIKISLCLTVILSSAQSVSAKIPEKTQQVIIGIARHKNSSQATLSLFEKHQNSWKQSGKTWKGRLGRNGLAWGIGLHPTDLSGLTKKEGDGRAPAGIFKIGSESGYAFGYAKSISKKLNLPYKQITTKDLWVEDPQSPHYNRHILLKHAPKTTWEKKAQMRQKDHAHSLKLFIAHNENTSTKPATPNAGSAIFFHIWRGGGTKPTAGCTTMSESNLKTMISKVDPAKHPCYILLTAEDYKTYRQSWKLP